MKRLARILLNVLTALSLILFVATLALWVRSYQAIDVLDIESVRETQFRSDRGFLIVYVRAKYRGARSREEIYAEIDPRVGVARITYRSADADASKWTADQVSTLYHPLPDRPWPEYLSHRQEYLTFTSTADVPGYHEFVETRGLYLPFWLSACVFLILPATRAGLFAIRRVKVRRGRRSGHCGSCGYDLRATPDRCPECGAVPAAKA